MSCEGNSKTTASASCFLKALLAYIIRKTMGLGFSKRWVSFHKTTRIFFEGFSHPSFFRSVLWVRSELALGSEFALGSGFALGSELAPGSKFALGSELALCFESGLLFVLSWGFCSFRFCFSLVLVAFLLVSPLFLWLDSTFFLILFGGFDFVRTFAATIP